MQTAAGFVYGARSKETMDIDEETAQRIRGMAAESHLLGASVRRAIKSFARVR